VEPTVSEARLTRQWNVIRERYRPRRAGRGLGLAVTLGAGVVLLSVGLLIMALRTTEPSAWDGAVLATAAERLDVTLKDGSLVEVRPRSRVEMLEGAPREVKFSLSHGSTRFSVAKVADRSFSVVSHGIEVRVTGTRFTVSATRVAQGVRVSVNVEEGTVRAGPIGESAAVLSAGQSWSIVRQTEIPPSMGQAEPEVTAVGPTVPAPNDTLPKATPPRAISPGAKELLETANSARQSGDAAAAARAYEALLSKFPNDGRAGLAAFELGRLKMDRLGDLGGAVRALKRATALAPNSGFREDALARLVSAYDTMGATASCKEAQRSYLASYPSGVHAGAVRNRCGGD
jgi:TolA-binding protein